MSKIYERFVKVEYAVASIFLLICVTVIFISAIMRLIGRPINWATDVALLLFTWSTFMGADLAWRRGKLVNVDILFNALPEKNRKPLKLAIYLICLAFICALIYLGFIQSVKTWYRSFNGLPWLSYTWVTLSVPVCMLSMAVTTILKIIAAVQDKTELNFL